eukprot:1194042-Prorocentrum_minimum.AAC.2
MPLDRCVFGRYTSRRESPAGSPLHVSMRPIVVGNDSFHNRETGVKQGCLREKRSATSNQGHPARH